MRQFNRVSPAVADAIVTAFPSPRLLQQVGPPPATLPPRYGGQVPEACSAHPCVCPRRTWPAAQSRSAWASWLTSL